VKRVQEPIYGPDINAAGVAIVRQGRDKTILFDREPLDAKNPSDVWVIDSADTEKVLAAAPSLNRRDLALGVVVILATIAAVVDLWADSVAIAILVGAVGICLAALAAGRPVTAKRIVGKAKVTPTARAAAYTLRGFAGSSAGPARTIEMLLAYAPLDDLVRYVTLAEVVERNPWAELTEPVKQVREDLAKVTHSVRDWGTKAAADEIDAALRRNGPQDRVD
jgi:hypothetical protein